MKTSGSPKKWKGFLHVNENKTELFKFLAQQLAQLPIGEGKVIYATNGADVLCTMTMFMYHDYVHTKKQTLVFSFMLQMQLGKVVRKLHLRTIDTDVVVLAIAMFNHLNADELWLAFGTKSHFWYNLFMKLLLD